MTKDLTASQRFWILVVAFLGWFFGGVQIGITNVAMRAAALDLMNLTGEIDLDVYRELQVLDDTLLTESQSNKLVQWNSSATRWYAWYQCAFLFGAAAGGWLFGRLGDQIGRSKSLAISILFFAVLTGVSYYSSSPVQLLLLRFFACVGIGGTWPNGVALVGEAWRGAARPMVSSAIGMAGNLGIFAIFSLSAWRAVTPDDWRWVMLVGASPIVLAIAIWFFIAESPAWIELQRRKTSTESDAREKTTRMPSYWRTVFIGILLATIPLIGGWGSANWMIPWAGEAGAAIGDDFLKANVGQARSITSIVGSLLAGVIACTVGRRTTYAICSIGALAAAQYAFRFTVPTDDSFLVWVAILGFFNGLYFGWLPFFIPELFDARVRSTGAGVSFNSGRIVTAVTIFITGAMKDWFGGDYAAIGRVTSWIFLLGIIAILFAPDTSNREMDQ